MKQFLPLVLSVCLLATAQAVAQAEGPAGDLRAFQGRWVATLSNDRSILFEIDEMGFKMTKSELGREVETAKGTFTIDETRDPKHMTWADVTYSSGKVLKINRCIYELHGDTWLLMGAIDERPKTFLSGEGRPHTTWIFKRQK